MDRESDFRALVGVDAARVARVALEEDGPRDITTDVSVPPELEAQGEIRLRTAGVLAGTTYADAVVEACGLEAVTWYHPPGVPVPAGDRAGVIRGSLAGILRAERPLLNLLQRAVGIATLTRAYADAVAGTRAKILHTRKTAPGLRLLDVSAVLAGGGHLHRLDLAGVLMIKDNHWAALERSGRHLAMALEAARTEGVEQCHVEVESLVQVETALIAGATRLLVDNQSPETVGEWAEGARRLRPAIEIEATGGITLANVRAYAEAGADFISVGALTHSAPGADLTLELKGL
ncbi:MAG TPA: carboxylating nicotinate-nucleotide diphosphorylase [Gemmatimonadales bacterium]|nr:carboxylating nicotinate-nucleotide diphosphorylase [Gemmatimonadales bacterium]